MAEPTRSRPGLILVLAAAIGALAWVGWVQARPLSAPLPDRVFLEELTWVEVRELVKAGRATVIVPTGGTEQNGPHVALGKHNAIVRHTAAEIARRLGDAVVAPVLPYTPEGSIQPATGHMPFAGTISLPPPQFEAALEAIVRSLAAHGFTTICLLGDSGDSQQSQAAVAARLDAEWRGRVRVIQVGDYYYANGQMEWLEGQGESKAAIGTHSGIRDTSETMAVRPDMVRPDRMARDGGRFGEPTGVAGDPTRASAERGERLLALKIETALRQIRRERGH